MCSLEFPDLEILDRQRDDLEIIGISGDPNADVVADFITQTGVTFPIVWDDGDLIHQIAFPPAISPYPRQVLVDAQGTILYIATEHVEAELLGAIDRAQ